MAKRRSYDKETRAAVMAALLEGQTIQQVSEEYEIPAGTVGRWSASMSRSDGADEYFTPDENEDIGTIPVQYMKESIITLIQHQMVFRDIKWLEKNDASSLAVLHGVQLDKVIRLLEAFNKHAPTDNTSQD